MDGITSGAALRAFHDREHYEKLGKMSAAARLAFANGLFAPMPRVSDCGCLELGENGELIYDEPLIKITAEEYLKILDIPLNKEEYES